jgi:hypothetical protein
MGNAKEKLMSRLTIIAFITSAVITSGYLPTAAAQESEATESKMEHRGMGGMGKMGMKQMDRDGDEAVSKDEFMQTQEDMFTKMDQDQDGVLNENEMGGMGGCMMMR